MSDKPKIEGLRQSADSAHRLFTHYIRLALREAGMRISGDMTAEIDSIILPALYPIINLLEAQQKEIDVLRRRLNLHAVENQRRDDMAIERDKQIDALQRRHDPIAQTWELLRKGLENVNGTLEIATADIDAHTDRLREIGVDVQAIWSAVEETNRDANSREQHAGERDMHIDALERRVRKLEARATVDETQDVAIERIEERLDAVQRDSLEQLTVLRVMLYKLRGISASPVTRNLLEGSPYDDTH